MQTLILRGAVIDHYKKKSSNTGPEMSLSIHADWSDTVCQAMGWTEQPEGFKGGTLEGTLFGVNLIMDPAKGDLKDFRFDIPISKVEKFKYVPKTKDGEQIGAELRCVVTTNHADAHILLDNWFRHVMDNPSQAKINVSEETQQDLIEEGEEESPKKTRGRRGAQKEAGAK